MDKDRIEGAAKQMGGSIKEGIGKLTGDAKPKPRARRRRQMAKCRMPWAA